VSSPAPREAARPPAERGPRRRCRHVHAVRVRGGRVRGDAL